jgi:hypothetical protein
MMLQILYRDFAVEDASIGLRVALFSIVGPDTLAQRYPQIVTRSCKAIPLLR